MKRLALLLLTMTMACTLAAQPHGKPGPFHSHKPTMKSLSSPTIVVQAQNSESFFVYLNGNLINDVPRSQVVIDRLDNNLQEVIIVLNQPARKAIVMDVYADMKGTTLTVDYSHRNDQLTVTGPSAPREEGDSNRRQRHSHNNPTVVHHVVVTPPPAPIIEEPQVVSDEWVNEMVGILNNQSFDTEKTETAKGLLNNGLPFTSDQIARIASTFTFSSGQVEFLKQAYTHCIDPENYERALTILTFSSDRQTVREYINSLR